MSLHHSPQHFEELNVFVWQFVLSKVDQKSVGHEEESLVHKAPVPVRSVGASGLYPGETVRKRTHVALRVTWEADV